MAVARLKVNRKTVEVFEGALVRHALLRYFIWKGLDVAQVDCLMKKNIFASLLMFAVLTLSAQERRELPEVCQ